MITIIIALIICETLVDIAYLTHPRTLRKYKLRYAKLKTELDKLKKRIWRIIRRLH